MCCIGLVITFSERNNPFDHEFFTRNSKDTIDTVKQMLTAGFMPYIPFLFYIPLYFLVIIFWQKKQIRAKNTVAAVTVITVAFGCVDALCKSITRLVCTEWRLLSHR
jgi:hypothetical protein